MARRETTVTITAEGRDNGKKYHVAEVSSVQADRWFMRAASVLGKNGYDIPISLIQPDEGTDATAEQRFGVLAIIIANAVMASDFEGVGPLMDEMLECVHSMPDTAHPEIRVSLKINPVEEVATIWTLRRAVLDLHLGMSLAKVSARIMEQLAASSPVLLPLAAEQPTMVH